MDDRRFDALTRLLTGSVSRKRLLVALASIAAPSLLATREVAPVAARKRRRKRTGRGHGDVVGQGIIPGCGGACVDSAACSDTCRCNAFTGQCQECGNFCVDDNECSGDCRCFDGFCQSGCPGTCQADDECRVFSEDCECIVGKCHCPTGTCDGSDACPGTCADNDDCSAQGANDRVCFLGVDTADAMLVARVIAEGTGGTCGSCLGAGDPCVASSECCGQLVCLEKGACGQKPVDEIPAGCRPHGGNCQRDSDCCGGQAACYRGECAEKDTDCRNDGDCAQGYRCQGGPLSDNHRRCRKNGRRRRNKKRRHA